MPQNRNQKEFTWRIKNNSLKIFSHSTKISDLSSLLLALKKNQWLFLIMWYTYKKHYSKLNTNNYIITLTLGRKLNKQFENFLLFLMHSSEKWKFYFSKKFRDFSKIPSGFFRNHSTISRNKSKISIPSEKAFRNMEKLQFEIMTLKNEHNKFLRISPKYRKNN